jgi:hypothetical protein
LVIIKTFKGSSRVKGRMQGSNGRRRRSLVIVKAFRGSSGVKGRTQSSYGVWMQEEEFGHY